MIQFVTIGDLEGKAQSVCRHIVNCMHVIARNYNRAVYGSDACWARRVHGHLEEDKKKRNMKSGAEVITTCEILGKQAPPRGPPVSLETTDSRQGFLPCIQTFCSASLMAS